MKILNLDVNDSEMFSYELDEDIYQFFSSERENFKKMWEGQGKTFWLRLLFTYQQNVECEALSKVNYEILLEIMKDRLVDFLLIYIHKNFIEPKCPEPAEKFMQGLLDKHRLFQNCNMTNSPMLLHLTKLFLIFTSNSKNLEAQDEFSSAPLIHLLCKLSFGFANAICILLKRWLKETDVNKDIANTLDYTLYYWRPFKYCDSGHFKPGCFEKYISTYWNKKLPKMLLIGKIDEIFSNHKISDCCEAYTMDREPCKELNKCVKVKTLNRIDTFSPDIALCSDHNNCCVKIKHDKNCLEPYMCKGNKPCVMTCETVCSGNKKKPSKEFLKNFSIKITVNKDGKTRDVATQVESDSQLETYFPVGPQICSVSDGLEELLFSPNPVLKNSYIQHRRREDYRLKLKKKLIKKYELDYEDPIQMKSLYDDAIQTFLKENASVEDLRDKLTNTSFATASYLLKSLEHTVNLKFKFLSVAVGTSGIIFGQIVLPSKRTTLLKSSSKKAVPVKSRKLSDESKNSKQTNSLQPNAEETIKNEFNKLLKSDENNMTEKLNKVSENDSGKVNDICLNTKVETVKPIVETNMGKSIEENNEVKGAKVKDHNNSIVENSRTDVEMTQENVENNKLKKVKQNSENKKVKENTENNKIKVKKDTENSKNGKLQIMENSETDKSDVDEDLKTFYNFVNTSEAKSDSGQKKHKLKSCAFCQKKEIEYKTFKRCSRCKVENLANQYYYCSRECQVADWEKSHRELHLKKN